MTVSASVPVAIALACYVISTNLRIDLGDRSVSLGAAFAPTLLVVAHGGHLSALVVLAIAACLVALVAGIRRMREVLGDAVALVTCALVVEGFYVLLSLSGGFMPGRIRDVVAGAFGLLAYSVVTDSSRRELNVIASADGRVWLLLQAVMLSAYGLMTLAYAQIGWPAVAAMLALLALTKGEFDRYGQARRTMDQTVVALEALRRASLS